MDGRVHLLDGVAYDLRELFHVNRVFKGAVRVVFGGRLDEDALGQWRHFWLRGVEREQEESWGRRLLAQGRTKAW